MDALKTGRSIAFLRKRYHMTQRQLANYLHISDKAVSKWERGLAIPDVSLWGKLSIILDTDIESILEGNISSFDVRWNGVLEMDYPQGVEASTLLYDKPAVYLQLSYFMLVGITNIRIRGKDSDVGWAKTYLKDGKPLGIKLCYEDKKDREENIAGIMRVHGLSFLYGKDLTKSFRRILYGEQFSYMLENHKGVPLGIQFNRGKNVYEMTKLRLDRGILAFPIQSYQDLFTAANMIQLIQQSMHENVYSLSEIAYRRGLICEMK